MSKLDGRVNKLERIDRSAGSRQEGMSDHDLRILQQLSLVELDLCPDMALATEADTDPQTFKEIQRTLAEARGEFEPEPLAENPPQAKSAPRPTVPRRRRPGRHREEDLDGMVEAIAFIDQTITASSSAVARMDRAVEAARNRHAQAPPAEQKRHTS